MKKILLLILTIFFAINLFCVPDNYRAALKTVIEDLSDYEASGYILVDERRAGQIIHNATSETEPESQILDLARQVYADIIVNYGTTEIVTGHIDTDEMTALKIALAQYGETATGNRIDDRNTLYDLIIAEGPALVPNFYDLNQWLPAQYGYKIDLDGKVEDAKSDYDAYNVGHGGSFNGTDSKLDLGSNIPSDLTGDITISCWINPAGWGEGDLGHILSNGKNILSLSKSVVGVEKLFFSSDGGTTLIQSANNSIILNKYQHLLITREADGITNFYIDSSQSGTANQDSGNPAAGTTNTFIGNRSASDRTFDGSIHDFRIYNKIVSTEERTQIYNGNLLGDEIYFCPDPSTGYDISGNANHGTPTNVTETDIEYYGYNQKYGFNDYMKCLTDGIIKIPIIGDYTYRYYDSSLDTWSNESGSTTGDYFELDIDANDLVTNIIISDVYVPLFTGEWIIESGTFADLIVPGLSDGSNVDALGNNCRYIGGTGILPNGKTEFNPLDSAYNALYPYNLKATISNALSLPQYWKDEVLLETSIYDSTNIYRHVNKDFNFDYLHALMTRKGLRKLSLKETSDDLHLASNNILNYNTARTDNQVNRIYQFYKMLNYDEFDKYYGYYDATNSKFDVGFQDEWCVAGYDFKNKYSMFADDDQFAELGWESEDKVTNGGFDTDTDWTKGAGWVISGGSAVATITTQSISQNVGFQNNKKYFISFDVTKTAGTLRLYCGGSNTIDRVSADVPEGHFEKIVTIPSSGSGSGFIYFYGTANPNEFTGSIDNVIVTEIGDTVEKLLDLGSGGADSVSYFNATQATATKQAIKTQYGLLADGVDDEYTIGDIDSVKAIVWKAKFGTFTEELLTLGTGKQLVLQDTIYKYAGDFLGFSIYGSPSTTEFTVNAIVFVDKQDADAVKLFTDGTGFGNIEMEYIKFFSDLDPTYNIWDDTEIWNDEEYWYDILELY